MLQPEQLEHSKIDALLETAGAVIPDPEQLERNACLAIAVREFQLPDRAAY